MLTLMQIQSRKSKSLSDTTQIFSQMTALMSLAFVVIVEEDMVFAGRLHSHNNGNSIPATMTPYTKLSLVFLASLWKPLNQLCHYILADRPPPLTNSYASFFFFFFLRSSNPRPTVRGFVSAASVILVFFLLSPFFSTSVFLPVAQKMCLALCGSTHSPEWSNNNNNKLVNNNKHFDYHFFLISSSLKNEIPLYGGGANSNYILRCLFFSF